MEGGRRVDKERKGGGGSRRWKKRGEQKRGRQEDQVQAEKDGSNW